MSIQLLAISWTWPGIDAEAFHRTCSFPLYYINAFSREKCAARHQSIELYIFASSSFPSPSSNSHPHPLSLSQSPPPSPSNFAFPLLFFFASLPIPICIPLPSSSLHLHLPLPLSPSSSPSPLFPSLHPRSSEPFEIARHNRASIGTVIAVMHGCCFGNEILVSFW